MSAHFAHFKLVEQISIWHKYIFLYSSKLLIIGSFNNRCMSANSLRAELDFYVLAYTVFIWISIIALLTARIY